MPNPEWFERRAPGIPRARQPGEEVWRLQHPDGRVQSCELRDDSKAGAGWDCLLLENDEPLFSRRCAHEAEARYVADQAGHAAQRLDGTVSRARAISGPLSHRSGF